MRKATITDLHGETLESLKKSKVKYQDIAKSNTKITVIMLCLEGYGVLDISKLLSISTTTAGKYIRDFNSGGLEKLLSYTKASGRPRTLSTSEQDLCYEVFQRTPKEAGIGVSMNWTSTLMQEFVYKEFGKKMTPTGIQKMLHRMGFSYTRPTYTLARADKKNQ